jgi:arylsulfatase A-like enzyme
VISWPGRILARATTDHLIGLTDVLATIAALCRQPLPDGAGPDSVNQLPALLQNKDHITERPALVTASYLGSLANRLKDVDYATYATGKYWEDDPRAMGFTHGTIDVTLNGFRKFLQYPYPLPGKLKL